MFVDYAGATLEVIDGLTGEVRAAQIFVAMIAMAGQRDVLDQQPDHALFLAVGRRGVVPQPGEVRRDFQNALANRFIEHDPVLLAKAIPLLFRIAQGL